MTDFMMIFRERGPQGIPTQEQIDASKQKWMNWIGGIAAQGKFVAGNPLGYEGKVVRPAGVITDGPFAETKEQMGGYIIVKASNLDEAATLAHGCPSFDVGGNVEIRQVMPM